MQVCYTPDQLIAFEDEIATLFASKRIHAPVHLAGGNEEQLIHVFREHVNEQDWVLCSWRSHYHCLLKGVPPDELRQAILDGKSISLCFPEHRVLSSGIVGGTAPIAVGLAMGIRRKRSERSARYAKEIKESRSGLLHITEHDAFGRDPLARKVVCFVGDMTAETGSFYEAVKYAVNFDLPMLFVVEDNGLSVSTSTNAAWGGRRLGADANKVLRYEYTLTRPHVGIGRHVTF